MYLPVSHQKMKNAAKRTIQTQFTSTISIRIHLHYFAVQNCERCNEKYNFFLLKHVIFIIKITEISYRSKLMFNLLKKYFPKIKNKKKNMIKIAFKKLTYKVQLYFNIVHFCYKNVKVLYI